jgi:hypothetical protein
MTGTLAQTIQGEAGSNPANQFAVAAAIANRAQAGSFPGGSDPTAIVNAPSQFTGFAGTPNASAQAFAAAIEAGTLGNYGDLGNATSFQSGQTAANNGFTAGGANIGGNWFSDRFGAPSSSFVAPSFTGNQLAQGPANSSSGIAAGSGAGSTSGLLHEWLFGDPFGQGMNTPSGSGGSSSSSSSSGGIFQPLIDAFNKAFATLLGATTNWVTRGFVILVGLTIIALGIYRLLAPDLKDQLKGLVAAIPKAAEAAVAA